MDLSAAAWGILDTAKNLLVSRDVLFMSKCDSIDAVEFSLDIQYDVATYGNTLRSRPTPDAQKYDAGWGKVQAKHKVCLFTTSL